MPDTLDPALFAPLARKIATAVRDTPVRLGTPEGAADLVAQITMQAAAYMGSLLPTAPGLARITSASLTNAVAPAADPAPWPFTLDDPVRATHFALEPDCPYGDPSSCPEEAAARRVIQAYTTWLAAHPHALTLP